ncbi:glycoside hydrolase [Opitutaceae bacterium]|nr:glycoside hydrolase [Opitutaceae bacterium]
MIDDDDEPRNRGSAFNGASPWRWVGQGFYRDQFRERQVDLSGYWAFSKGDDPSWSDPAFDHSGWKEISAEKNWERQGFGKYNGFAWYRRSFEISAEAGVDGMYLRLGRIDDADETYFNGVKIGATGRVPPTYATGWDGWRVYRIPRELIRHQEMNTVAIRVYDEGGEGGLSTDKIGIYQSTLPEPLLDLAGEWELSLDDDPSHQLGIASQHEGDFSAIIVPGYWDTQGHGRFDGHAWYRRSFDWNGHAGTDELTLLMGRIDDQDEVYLNGTLVGQTGGEDDETEYWRSRRAYAFSASLLRSTDNVLTVRVYDEAQTGGIYTGPVGIMTSADAKVYWEQRLAPRRVWKTVWDWLLGRN